MRILVTGFEPFGGDTENASREAVLGLPASVDGVEVVTGILPVAFRTAPTTLRALVAEHEPDAVIAVGEAGGRTAITPELHGRNRMDARIPDELGDQPREEPIDDGPALRPATIEVDALVAAIRAAGLPAEPSHDAGGFVCNRVAVEVAGLGVPAVFVHVPAVRSRGIASVGAETDADASAARAELAIDDLVAGLVCCIRVAAGASGTA